MGDFASKQITIIGPGLLGGSVGLALRAAGFSGRIVGTGRTASTLEAAKARGCVDDTDLDVAEAVAGSDLVLIATPVDSIPTILEALGPVVAPDAVITDVGSTKASIVAAAEAALPNPSRFVGSHPMAGGTGRGPDAAIVDLFAGKPCIITPTDKTDGDAAERVEALWSDLGMRLVRLSPADHDRQTAVVSHMPHLAAVMLVLGAVQEGGWGVASTGFRDTTRLASSNPPMRRDIIMDNAACLIEGIADFEMRLAEFRGALEAGDADAVLAWLERAQDARDHWLSSS